MNPNIPYGQQLPMQPPSRRHDGSYNQIPPHLRPHSNYQQYYPQPMHGHMMPQYPQHYPQNWYAYQHHTIPHHPGRPQYYSQPSPMPMAPPIAQHHGPLIVSSQQHAHMSPRHAAVPPNIYPVQQASSTASTASVSQIQTPPSRPVSSVSTVNARKDTTPPITPTTVPELQVPIPAVQESKRVTDETPARYEPFFPPLPWLSVTDEPFPPRAPRIRRTVLRSQLGTEPITFPMPEEPTLQLLEKSVTKSDAQQLSEISTTEGVTPMTTETSASHTSGIVTDSLHLDPTVTSSRVPDIAVQPRREVTPTQAKAVRAAVPVVPIIPALPQSPTASRAHRDSVTSTFSKGVDQLSVTEGQGVGSSIDSTSETQSGSEKLVTTQPAPPPSSWAALLRSKNAAADAAAQSTSTPVTNGLALPKGETLGDVLNEISVSETPTKVAFIQPRGLINTGNMCYMNSILQMLVFCVPFHEFLDRVAKRASYTFKSDTPLIDAMIMFMREYPSIDTATSVDQLVLRLKPEDYEKYGESFIPEYVYNVIKQLPRFRDMRRGHQQDAQEFLGFLLEELHEECARAMHAGSSAGSGGSTPIGNASNTSEAVNTDSGWMEVGAKQKAAVTRSSGAVGSESPVTSIFGGKLRSELKVAGNKLSVTLEPYQPLQLDIGSPQVSNIIEALKGITRPESMQGDFQSARGTKTTATKQVFIETLPPVLILHLKRFHYDAGTKRVEKIWKKVGYPLELEIPKEIFPLSARNKLAAQGGSPKYRLIGVIYHHGKSASGGHYTVDIRRQDGREWIRVDDTLIRRVRSEDVAEGGSEEDPKVLAAALERHNQNNASVNRFDQIDAGAEDDEPDKVWSQVNGHARSKSTLTSVVNGVATPKESSGPQTPRDRYSVKDNKVAYLLFYQRVVT